MSVEGRFEGAVPDNAYLAALDAAGPLGLAAVLALLLGLAFLAYRRVWPRPDADSGYVLAAGAGCALSGMFLRAFQVFPLWVFVAFGMAVVLTAVLPGLKGEVGVAPGRGDGPA
jgi:O-antigen ligase